VNDERSGLSDASDVDAQVRDTTGRDAAAQEPVAASTATQRPRRRMALAALLSILISLFVVFNRSRETAGQYLGRTFDPPLPAADFTLTDMQGRPFRMADASGQVRLLFFGYTSCPDICPTTMGQVASALGQLDPADRAGVKVLFVSVDPERDDAAKLSAYLTGYGPEFLGLTGSLEALQAVAASYLVTFYDEPAQEGQPRLITHSGSVFLVDRAGQIPVSFAGPFDPADLAHDLKLALR
jgi:protein SCO1/2